MAEIVDGDVVELPYHRQLELEVPDLGAGLLTVTAEGPAEIEVTAGASPAERVLIPHKASYADVTVRVDADPDLGVSALVKKFRVNVPVRRGILDVSVKLSPGGEWRTLEQLGGELKLPKNRTAHLMIRAKAPTEVKGHVVTLQADSIVVESGSPSNVRVEGNAGLFPDGSIGTGPFPVSITADVCTGSQEIIESTTVQVYITAAIANSFEIDGELEDQP
jgi:hypothetical protein